MAGWLRDAIGREIADDAPHFRETLSTSQGKLVANPMASLAEFEHGFLRGRVRSGIVAVTARGRVFGRRLGHRPSDKVCRFHSSCEG